jgi:hypothetical protein
LILIVNGSIEENENDKIDDKSYGGCDDNDWRHHHAPSKQLR